MSIQTFLLAVLVVVYGAAQYILAAQAIRDLVRRPSVRGGNKTVWGIVILTIPIGGALLYNWMGPTSFLRRHGPAPATVQQRPVTTRRAATAAQRRITTITTLQERGQRRPAAAPPPRTPERPAVVPVQRDAPRPPTPWRHTGS